MHSLSLREYATVLGATGAVCGAIVGVAGLVIGLSGGEVFFHMGRLGRLDGVAAGLLGLPLMPILFSSAGVVASTVLYWPVRMVLGASRDRRSADRTIEGRITTTPQLRPRHRSRW